ncbi:MAG TPA: Bpu10I family restriction endonuclease [Bacteroidota bacterium]|nr:Bpu10I family restriction endonuclease [Candidatus Kapabacteria bacterium]HRS02043.1 Bpu10I family restriction endonuclease [Bacteroidota bacterium]
MSNFIHGDNLEHKIRIEKDPDNKKLLTEINEEYKKWKNDNLNIKGTERKDIQKKVDLFNKYKNFIEQPKFKKQSGNNLGFTSQSQLHSSALEEFMYYLFKDIEKLTNKNIYWGRTQAYTNLYFAPPSIDAFEESSNIVINVKNQDFSISKEVILKSRVSNNEDWQENKIYVPIVSIECKTYLDKTMYEGSASTAEKIKRGNPYCIFLIVTETYEVSLDVDPKYSSIDQIYVLRKENKNNPIYEDVVWDLFKYVETHINSDWYNVRERIKKGKMI